MLFAIGSGGLKLPSLAVSLAEMLDVHGYGGASADDSAHDVTRTPITNRSSAFNRTNDTEWALNNQNGVQLSYLIFLIFPDAAAVEYGN